MRKRTSRFLGRTSGQALIESALVIPFLLMIIFNAVNFGFFFYVALNMTAATRSGGLYAILGPETPLNIASFPPAGSISNPISVSYLVYQDMTGALPSPSTGAAVQVCSSSVGVQNPGTTSQSAGCQQFGSGTFSAAPADPEAPRFMLHQVDIIYTFEPLIPGTPFGAVLLATPTCTSSGGITCTFHRRVLMRAM